MPMPTETLGANWPQEAATRPVTPTVTREYFSEVAHDYASWSPGYHMHFGYWRAVLNPLRREPMLEELNRVAARGLDLPPGEPHCIVDLGCGATATARTLARDDPSLRIVAVTNVPAQLGIARELNASAGVTGRIACMLADYTATGLPTGQADGVIAIESACYASGSTKADFAREAARLLRPGARLVVIDGFLLRGTPGRWAARLHRLWADCWAVPSLARLQEFREELEHQGFQDVRIRSLRWRIAPSAMHIPVLATRYSLVELWKARGRLSPWRRRHIIASYCALLLGLLWRDFDYCEVIATRGPSASNERPS